MREAARQLLHALDRSLGAVDVEQEARRLGPVADEPQPAAQQHERVVRGEEHRHEHDRPAVAVRHAPPVGDRVDEQPRGLEHPPRLRERTPEPLGRDRGEGVRDAHIL